MAIEEDSATMLIGFVIVLVVGLNVILFFGDISDLGGSPLTGAAVAGCKDASNGIECGDQLFIATKDGVCPSETIKVCTNNCELTRYYANDARICPTACIDVCAPSKIAKRL
jgi:hypothetical protein